MYDKGCLHARISQTVGIDLICLLVTAVYLFACSPFIHIMSITFEYIYLKAIILITSCKTCDSTCTLLDMS